MQVLVSKAYRKWRKSTKNANAVATIERFLCRVFVAKSIKDVSPTPKAAGANLRKTPGSVDEFSLGRQERVYARVMELDGVATFCVATAGLKGGTNQNGDIYNALKIFDDIEKAEFTEWGPSLDRLMDFVADNLSNLDNIPEEVASTEFIAPEEGPAKKKGKPVDENGLTVAERKALRKKEREMEKQKKLAEEQKRRAEARRAEQARLDAQQEVVSATGPAAEIVAAPTVTATTDVPVEDLAPDDVKFENANTSVVALNGAPVDVPEPATGDVHFEDVMNTQYELELIEHQIKIERLQIEILQYNIAKAQHEITLEELAIKKLKILQAQKAQEMQK